MAEQEIQTNDGSVISVMIPTRGRVKSGIRKKVLPNLLENAKNPAKIEPMLGVDDDDLKKSIDWVNNEAEKFMQKWGCSCKASKVFKLGL